MNDVCCFLASVLCTLSVLIPFIVAVRSDIECTPSSMFLVITSWIGLATIIVGSLYMASKAYDNAELSIKQSIEQQVTATLQYHHLIPETKKEK